MLPILYSYDVEDGQIRPLPASPFLLPAIFIFFISRLFIRSPVQKYGPLPYNFNAREYERNRQLYYKILPKIKRGDELSLYEHNLWYNVLPYPSWSKNGERWQY